MFGQGGPTELDSVEVSNTAPQLRLSQEIRKVRIQRRLVTDVGQLMSLFTGVQTKSYGGLGGMKTVTFRSLGAGHISVVSDHFALSQTQSGQADLGQIPVDFINKLELVGYNPLSVNYPIHSKLAGQIIAMETRHVQKVDSFSANIGTQFGSFGQMDGHAFVSKRLSKWQVAGSLKGRRFDGNYPFSYLNGQTSTKTTRTNGDLVDAFGTASVSYFFTALQKLHASYSGAYYDKGLPGAVVFYNETANQRLFGNNHLFTLRHSGSNNRFIYSSGASFQQSQLNYVDSNYLNAAGFLHSRFVSQESTGQYAMALSFTQRFFVVPDRSRSSLRAIVFGNIQHSPHPFFQPILFHRFNGCGKVIFQHNWAYKIFRIFVRRKPNAQPFYSLPLNGEYVQKVFRLLRDIAIR